MKRMLSTVSILTLAACILTAANAASPNTKGKIARGDDGLIGTPYTEETTSWGGTWTGPYVGLGVGILSSLAAVEGEGGPLIDSVGAWGWVGDVKVGYDYRLPNTPFVIGLFGGWSLGSAKITGLGEQASITPTWNVGGRAGLVSWNSSLIYVGYKYNQADVDLSFAEGPGTIGGHSVIGGIEMPVSKGVTLGLEYSGTQWDDFHVGPVRVEPMDHRILLRANLRFGGLGQ